MTYSEVPDDAKTPSRNSSALSIAHLWCMAAPLECKMKNKNVQNLKEHSGTHKPKWNDLAGIICRKNTFLERKAKTSTGLQNKSSGWGWKRKSVTCQSVSFFPLVWWKIAQSQNGRFEPLTQISSALKYYHARLDDISAKQAAAIQSSGCFGTVSGPTRRGHALSRTKLSAYACVCTRLSTNASVKWFRCRTSSHECTNSTAVTRPWAACMSLTCTCMRALNPPLRHCDGWVCKSIGKQIICF